jgi:hypothetical protein
MNINTNEVLIHTINTRGDYPCNRLRARKIWEVLYRHADGKDFKSFDNFLIDLRCFEEQLDKQAGESAAIFYWAYSNGKWTHTKIFTPEDKWNLVDLWDSCWMIQVIWDRSLMNFYRVEVLDTQTA